MKLIAFSEAEHGRACYARKNRLRGFELTKTMLLAMKLMIVFFLAGTLGLSAHGIAQSITLSLRNAPMEQVFKVLEKQTDYRFVYSREDIQKAAPVTLQLNNVRLDEALAQCFKGQPLGYTMVDKLIVVKGKVAKSVVKEDMPPIDVNGKVTDDKGMPATGVTITIKGTSRTTISDNNGEFSFRNIDGSAILIFSSVNTITIEVPIDGRDQVIVKLKSKVAELSSVAVSVSTGYQQISKERAVGSYTKVDSALFNREVSTDLLSRLNGIANSLLFDTHIGTTQHLQIRGISTIQSGAEPLIILDNFPYTGNINNINPNDVLDITILKDAAAASIWGAKAGNGVIVITTKKGKYNQPMKLFLSSNVTIQEKPDLFSFPQMGSSDFIDVEKFLFAKGAYTANLSNTTTRPIISPVVEILNKQKNGQISQTDADAQIDALRSVDVRNDYNKYIFRNAINQQNYVNLSGGSSTIGYNFSGGFDHNLAQYKGSNAFDRYSLNAATTFKPTRNIEFLTSLVFTQSDQSLSSIPYPINPSGGKAQLYPYAKLADENGNHLAIPYKYRLAYVDTVGGGKLLDWHYRPLDELYNQSNKAKTQYVLVNVGARINLLSWLNADLKYQYGSQTNGQQSLYDQNSFYTRDLINSYTNLKSTVASIRNPIPIGGIMDLSNTVQTSQNFRGQFNFLKSWNNMHELNGLLAAEISQVKSQSNSDRYYGYNNNTQNFSTQIDYNTFFPNYMTGSTSPIPNTLNYSSSVNRTASFLANVSYRYNRRYSIYASARKDGSNFFGVATNNRWKPLWSVGGGWDIMKESFYNVSFLPSLRLRASYGYTGNINNSIPAATLISYGANNPVTGTPTAFLTYAPNPDLRWEQVGIFNVGLDFGLFDNRITGTGEWFKKNSQDVIANYAVDPTLGLNLNQTILNAASLSTTGIDVQIVSQNIIAPFSWSTTINFSYAKTIVTDYFQNPVKGIPSVSDINPAKGNIAWGVYAYKWAGLDPATGDPQGFLGKQVSKNYTGIMNDSFQNHVLVGSSLPLYFGNVLNSFSFKGFTLSANIIYKFDYYFRKPALNYTSLFNSWIGNNDYVKRWQTPGDEKNTTVPSMIYPSNTNRDAFYGNSEVNVEKGDNIRLNDVRLSYGFNSKNVGKSPIKSMQFFAYANNLNWYIWRASKSGYNPDFASTIIPPTKSISLGINLTF